MSEGTGGTWPGSEDDTVDKARAWDAAVAIPPKVAAELTALRSQVSELRADLEVARNLIREARLADSHANRTGDETRFSIAFDALCRYDRATTKDA